MKPIAKKSLHATSNRGLYTPEPVQDRVIARHFAGESNDEIAKAEHLDPGTVRRILSQPRVAQMKAEYHAQALSQIDRSQPQAARVLIELKDCPDPRIRYLAVVKLLELGEKNKIEMPKEESDPDERVAKTMAPMISMMMVKSRRYGMELPADTVEKIAEIKQRMGDESLDSERAPVPEPRAECTPVPERRVQPDVQCNLAHLADLNSGKSNKLVGRDNAKSQEFHQQNRRVPRGRRAKRRES